MDGQTDERMITDSKGSLLAKWAIITVSKMAFFIEINEVL